MKYIFARIVCYISLSSRCSYEGNLKFGESVVAMHDSPLYFLDQ